MLIVSGSIEVHPGPRSNHQLNQFSFAFWNLNSLVARDGARLSQIEALIANTNFHIFGICESSLSKDIPNEKIKIHGFSPSPFRADCPNIQDHRKGGVALYYRENLPIKERLDLLSGLEETIIAEIELKNKKSIFYILSYRSPSQNKEEYVAYFKKIESVCVTISKLKPSGIILCGDFNARSPLFWDNESTETPEGKILSDFMMLNYMEQLINEPTHLPDNSSTCIDLILTDQPDAFVDSGVIASLDDHCKHQIIYGKLNFNTPCPPPYKRTIWEYKKADIQAIELSFQLIDWNILFQNLSADDTATKFTKTLTDIMAKYIPHKTVLVNDKDAPWITPEIKTAIKRNQRVYRKWKNRGRNPEGRDNVKSIQCLTSQLIREAKGKYIKDLTKKLCDARRG